MLFKIYAGLSGGFGGAKYIETLEFESRDDAEQYAYDCAVECYESYEGSHGLRTFDEIMEEEDVEEDEAIDIYNEEMEDWLEYFAVEVIEDEDGNDITPEPDDE